MPPLRFAKIGYFFFFFDYLDCLIWRHHISKICGLSSYILSSFCAKVGRLQMPCKVAFSRRLDHHRVVLLQGGFFKLGNWSQALHGQSIANMRELMPLYWESKLLLKPQCQKRGLGTVFICRECLMHQKGEGQ